MFGKAIHNELLKAAELNGVNRMLTWGGVGAGIGGAYGTFSDTGTTMEGAFKGALLGGGAAAGLKYYGNKYATGMGRVWEATKHFEGAADFTGASGSVFNNSLNTINDYRAMSNELNLSYFGIGADAKFGENVSNATGVNKKVSQTFQNLNSKFNDQRGTRSNEDFITSVLGTDGRDKSSSIYSSSNSLLKDLKNRYGSVS